MSEDSDRCPNGCPYPFPVKGKTGTCAELHPPMVEDPNMKPNVYPEYPPKPKSPIVVSVK